MLKYLFPVLMLVGCGTAQVIKAPTRTPTVNFFAGKPTMTPQTFDWSKATPTILTRPLCGFAKLPSSQGNLTKGDVLVGFRGRTLRFSLSGQIVRIYQEKDGQKFPLASLTLGPQPFTDLENWEIEFDGAVCKSGIFFYRSPSDTVYMQFKE